MVKTKRESIESGLNALVWKEQNLFVAKAVEVEMASQGKTEKQALINLKEALELYFEDEKITQEKIVPLRLLKLRRLSSDIGYA